jgi:hypothetical protein
MRKRPPVSESAAGLKTDDPRDRKIFETQFKPEHEGYTKDPKKYKNFMSDLKEQEALYELRRKTEPGKSDYKNLKGDALEKERGKSAWREDGPKFPHVDINKGR